MKRYMNQNRPCPTHPSKAFRPQPINLVTFLGNYQTQIWCQLFGHVTEHSYGSHVFIVCFTDIWCAKAKFRLQTITISIYGSNQTKIKDHRKLKSIIHLKNCLLATFYGLSKSRLYCFFNICIQLVQAGGEYLAVFSPCIPILHFPIAHDSLRLP